MRAALVPPRQNRWPVLLVAAALLGLTIAAAGAVGAFQDRPPLDLSVVPPSASLPALGDVEFAGAIEHAGARSERGPIRTRARRSRSRRTPSPRSYRAGCGSGPRRASPTTRSSTSLCSMSATVSSSSTDRCFQRLRVVRGHGVAPRKPVCVLADRVGGARRSRRDALARGHGSTPARAGRSRCGSSRTCTRRSGSPASATDPSACAHTSSGAPATLRARPKRTSPAPMAPHGSPDHGGWSALARHRSSTPRRSVARGLPSIRTGRCRPQTCPPGAMVDLEGAFDHPAAGDCRPGAAGPDARPLAASAARLSCRARFVVTGVAVRSRLSDGQRRGDHRHGRPPGPLRPWPRPVSATSCFRAGRGSGSSMGRSIASDYEWFQVVAPSVDVGDGVPRVGWVAASEHGAEPWLGGPPWIVRMVPRSTSRISCG